MKKIIERLWLEPAFFIQCVTAAGVTLLQIVDLPDQIEIPVSALLVLAGGAATRQLVMPVLKFRRNR